MRGSISIEMTRKKKINRFWNVIIVLTLVGCIYAFVVHYKNWTKIENDELYVTSGIYNQKVALAEISAFEFVPKLPQMERKNGFSWLAREKGVFLDSITGHTVYVFVDDLRQQKLRIQFQDSLQLYLNLADSLETQKIYESIKELSLNEL